MIEKDIESNIIDAARAAYEAEKAGDIRIMGGWQSVVRGEQKDVEGAEPAILYVLVSPRAFESNALPEVTFDVAATVVIPIDLDPTGDAISKYCDPLCKLLQGWNLALHARCHDDCGFAVPGFVPHFINFAGGSAPEWSADGNAWTVTFNLVIGGTVCR